MPAPAFSVCRFRSRFRPAVAVLLASWLLVPGCLEDVQLAPPPPDMAPECQVCTADACEPIPDGSACAGGVCLSGACAPVTASCQLDQGFLHASAGGTHTCAIGVTGALACWGDNLEGQLGLGDNLARPAPSVVAGGPWELASAGGRHTCAQRADNSAWCWGRNSDGQLGIDSRDDQTTPALISGDATAWTQLALDSEHTCGIDPTRQLWCWGDNDKGELGTSDPERVLAPRRLEVPEVAWREIALGQRYTCAVDWNGDLWCWGENQDGALGLDSLIEQQPTPTQVAAEMSFTSVAAGGRRTCAIDSAGDLWCWGRNSDGEVGIGRDGGPVNAPTLVETEARFEALALGSRHGCGITRDNALYCWGDNQSGQLGLGHWDDRSAPVRVGAAEDWIAVTAGGQHTCGLRANGALYCWGANASGQLGLGDLQPRQWPTQVCSVAVIE